MISYVAATIDSESRFHSSIPMTSADQAEYLSEEIVLRPSHTSVVVSANLTEAGSICQECPTLTAASPRTTRPFGMCGAASPASSLRAVAISSASATRTVTTTSFGGATGW